MKKSFTLIELLVVIAIIAILASMLLPALNQARQTAKKIKCTGTLKQYAMAAQMYSSQNNDYMVPGNSGKGDPTWYRNMTFIQLLGGGYVADTAANKTSGHTGRGMICPDATLALSPAYSNSGMADISRSYGVSGDDFAGWGQGDKIEAFKITRVKQPSQRLAFADGMDWALYRSRSTANYYRLYREAGGYPNYAAYRHGNLNLLNSAMYDGHVTTMASEDVVKTQRWTKLYDAYTEL